MTSPFAKPFLSTLAIAAAITVGLLLSTAGAVGGQAGTEPNAGDITAFGRDVKVTTPLAGDLQVFGGDVVIGAPVSGNVVVIGGNVTLREDGRIDGDLVCLAGQVRGLDRSKVRGEIYAPASGYQTVGAHRLMMASMRDPFSLLTVAFELSLLFVWLVVAVIVTLTNGREIRASSLELRASSLHTFLLGLVAFTSFVLTAIVFSYLIPYFVGLVFLIALIVFAVLAKVYGMVAVFHAVGFLIAGPRTHEQALERRWLRGDLALAIVGFFVLGALRLIPHLGPVIWMTASALAVGVALSTKFGRREPWFLAYPAAGSQHSVVSSQ